MEEGDLQGHMGRVNVGTVMAMRCFTGNSGPDASDWLAHLEEVALLSSWSAEQRLQVAKVKCEGGARVWMGGRDFPDWNSFKFQFLQRFGETTMAITARYHACRQLPQETALEYQDRFLALAAKAGAGSDASQVARFFDGLREEVMDRLVPLRSQLHTIAQVVEAAQGCEEYSRNLQRRGPGPRIPERPEPRPWRDDRFPGPPPPAPQRQPYWNRERQGHPNNFQPQPNPAGNGWERRAPGGGAQPGRNPMGPGPLPGNPKPPGIDELVEGMKRLQLLVEAQQRQLNRPMNGAQRGQMPGGRHANLMMQGSGEFPSEDAFADGAAAFMLDSEDDAYGWEQAQGCNVDPAIWQNPQAEAYVKRGAGDEFAGRVPHKRQAVPRDFPPPPGPKPQAPPNNRPPEQHMGPSRMPYQRTPFDVRAGGTQQGATGAAAGPSSGPKTSPPKGANPAATPQVRAAAAGPGPRAPAEGATTMGDLAVKKGREMAERACKEVVVDGVKEAALSVQAVKICAAGFLMGSEHFVEKGKHVATKVADNTQKISNAPYRRTPPGAAPPPAQALVETQAEVTGPMQELTGQSTKDRAYSICRAWVSVNGLPVIACIDSGACSSMIPLHTVKRANLLHHVSKDSQPTFYNADGHESKGHGVIRGLGVHIGGDTLMKVNATVSKASNYDLLLGNDFLGPLKANLDFSRGRLYFQKDESTTGFVDLHFQRSPATAAMMSEKPAPASPDTLLVMPPAEEGVAIDINDESEASASSINDDGPVRLPTGSDALEDYPDDQPTDPHDNVGPEGEDSHSLPDLCAPSDSESGAPLGWSSDESEGEEGWEPNETTLSRDPKWLIQETILAEDPGSYEAYSSQLMAYDFLTMARGREWPEIPANLRVPRDTILDNAYDNIYTQPQPTMQEKVQSLHIGDHLTYGQKTLLRRFLGSNLELMAFKPEDLGLTGLTQHVINTGDNPPVKRSFIRMGKPMCDRLRAKVDEQMRLGLIRPSNSPWSSPALLVKKPDGGDRLVIDYRLVNAVTVKDTYPLPRMDDILDNLGKAVVFSQLDCQNGYYQVPLHPDSIPKSVFWAV